ncbi:hypothetical protein ZWY2020_011243, partial [Hordeum vulgare]
PFAAAADETEPTHHFSDYGFDPTPPAADACAAGPWRFKLQKPISKKHQHAQHNSKQRRGWWSSAAPAALLSSSAPPPPAVLLLRSPRPLYFADDGGDDDSTGICAVAGRAVRSPGRRRARALPRSEFPSAPGTPVSVVALGTGGCPAMPIYP